MVYRFKKTKRAIFMNRYEVKKYLESYRLAKNEVDRLNSLRRELELDITSLKSIDYSKIRVDGGASNAYVLEAVIDKIAELDEKIASATLNKYRTEKDVLAFIGKLKNDNNDVDILTDRYIFFLSYKALERKYNYTYESLKNKISKAYKTLAILSKL